MFGDFNEGQIIPVNKPYKWNSTFVVTRIKQLTKAKRVGHAGTLDPLATGVLVVCTGKATKGIMNIQAMEKEYTGTIVLGATTPSCDAEFEPDTFFEWKHITEPMLQETARSFLGEQMQSPPRFSAVKVDGVRSYERSRAGEVFELKARPVHIQEFEITRVALPEVDFRIVCSKGTYIRKIAYDFGERLQSGGYLSALCRTRVGEYSLKNAFEMKNLIDLLKQGRESDK